MHITYSYGLHFNNFTFCHHRIKKGKSRKEYPYQAPLIYGTVRTYICIYISPCFCTPTAILITGSTSTIPVTCSELDSISRKVIGYDVRGVFLFTYRIYLKNDRDR